MTLLDLLLAFMRIGAFSVGGGYAALPLIKACVLEEKGWLTAREFADLITISEMTPGPIGINAASFIGARCAGIPGSLCATLGFILPSCVVVSLLSYLYGKYRSLPAMDGALRGLRPAVVGLIAGAALTMLRTALFGATGAAVGGVDLAAAAIFAAALLTLRKWKASPIAVIGASGAAGLAVYTLLGGA